MSSSRRMPPPIKGRPLPKFKSDHKKLHLQAIEKEDKKIRQLENRLKLKKKKTLPKCFYDEGLGDIIDFIDKTSAARKQKDDDDSDDQLLSQRKKFKQDKPKKQGDIYGENSTPNDKQKDDLEISNDDEHDESDDDLDSEGTGDDEDMDDLDEMDSDESVDDSEGEDQSDSQSESENDSDNDPPTSVTKDEPKNKPSATTNKIMTKDIKIPMDSDILRKARGIINKLGPQNIAALVKDFETTIINKTSRHQVYEVLWDSLGKNIFDVSPYSVQLSATLSVFISVLGEKHGQELSANILHRTVRLVISDQESTKRIQAGLGVLLHFYIAGMIQGELIFEILDRFASHEDESVGIELVLFILKSVGFDLRKESAVKMRKVIEDMQKKCSVSTSDDQDDDSRLKFMKETLIALKNNNPNKLKGYGSRVDSQLIRSTLLNVIKRVKVSPFKGKLEDIATSAQWWQRSELINLERQEINKSGDTSNKNDEETDLTKFAKRLGLNTPLRQLIFETMINSNDYQEAAENLLRIAGKQHGQVVSVILFVALKEGSYNEFYIHLLRQLGLLDRQYKFSTKCSLIENIEKEKTDLLARVTVELIMLDTVPLTVLKPVILNGEEHDFCAKCLKLLISHSNAEKRKEIFQKLTPATDKQLSSAVDILIRLFIDKNLSINKLQR